MSYCSIGSQSVVYDYEYFEASSEQPDFNENKTEEVDSYSIIVAVLAALFVVFATILCLSISSLHPILRLIDILGKYKFDAELQEVRRDRTIFGGLCQIFFLGTAFLICAQTFIAYSIDNVDESKALIPYAILKDSKQISSEAEEVEFKSELTMELKLENYFADCGSCNSNIELYIDDVPEHNIKCSRDSNNHCTIKYKTSSGSLKSSTLWTYRFSDTQSYCSGILATIVTDSSIPGKQSNVSQTVAAQKGQVFKGLPPTVLSFSAIPSFYQNKIEDEEETGYHILVDKAPQPGSQAIAEDVQFEDDLTIIIELNRSENALLTVRSAKEAWFLLLFALIGSIIGVFEIIEIVKVVIDTITKKSAKHLQDKTEDNNLKIQKRKLRDLYK